MVNELIYYLTNRSSHQSELISNSAYSPIVGGDSVYMAADVLRKVLNLHINGVDWFWMAPISCLLANKSFTENVDITLTTTPRFWKPTSPEAYNGKFSGVVGRPKIHWVPKSLPDSFYFEMVYSEGAASITNGSSSYKVPCKIDTERGLVPDLSEAMPGAEFGIVSESVITAGISVGWYVEPSVYPISDTLRKLEALPQHAFLLAAYSESDSYSAFPDDVYKLGLLTWLIIRATKEHGY